MFPLEYLQNGHLSLKGARSLNFNIRFALQTVTNFLYEEQSCRSVNASVIIMFMVTTQSRALMQKLPSFVNIMT